MRHRVPVFKLKRDKDERRGLLRNLVLRVINDQGIVTTPQKAKAAKALVEKMITLANEDTLHSRRMAAAFLDHLRHRRSCSTSSEPVSGTGTAATPASCVWAGARATARSR